MVTRSDKLAMIGPSLADLVLEIFCFAASPSFRGVATLVSKARQAVKDAGSSSPELARDHSDLGKRITDALVTKVKAAREQCLDRGIDTSLLAQAESAVAALISTDAEKDLVVLSAVRDPAGFENYLRTRGAKHRQQIDEQAEPYFDALVQAVAATYVEIAPWSDSFVVVALKSLLGECSDIKEYLNASQIENRQLLSQILQILQSLTEAIEALSKPSHTERVFFGSRPDVVAENRFVERSEQEHLKAVITDPTRHRTVLLGMRGCGKTQLAASLAKQCEDENWNLVAWVNAVSPDSIKSSLVELAKELKIDTSDQPTQEQIVGRCLNYLRSSGGSDRLIVFDNVEDINDLRGFIPTGEGLRVVATTTNDKGWNYQGWAPIRIGVFDRETSIDYLLTVTNSADREAAYTLAERLGDLPLALAQAAASARNGDLSLARYMDRLDSYGSERVIRPVPGDYYADDVATTLCMAIEDALENLADPTRRYARRQLGALALLAESGVPTRWLDPTVEQQNNQELQGANQAEDEDAHDALTELIHRSIVQQSADKATTMLHRLQAQVFRESWDEKETAEAYESSTMLLSNVNIDRFPRNETDSRRRETRDLIEQLHAIGEQKYARNIFTHENVPVRVFQALSNAHDLALFSEALTLEASINTIQEILGPEHPGTLAASNNLAHAYEAAGYFHDAIGMYEQVLADHTRVFGASHPYTFTIANNLAGAYESGGYFDKAINLYRQVLADRIYALGPDHPDVLTTQNDLAYACVSAGLHSEAIAGFDLVFKKRLSLLGPDDLHTLLSRNNLASAYASAGYSITAIALFLQAFAEFRRVLGPDHHYTLAARRNIAELYASAGLLNAAVPLYEDVLSDYQRILGLEHPLTKTVRENLEAAKRELEQQEEDSAAE
ncbi:tetratricopeptide repeat protein [Actinomyces bouchesdurhonensis]|uniref:tetratricopeptide repeat protein n=1 Tax=Actinomyces bouchesdurhonensis TaxID=1852361 RepID=UPI0028E653CA|nr:tetratricopeptide repeat protein [Actinomyces bouchesdurhonensis]